MPGIGALFIASCVSLVAAAPAAAEGVVTLHGEARVDEFAWLKAGGADRAVRAHLAAENRRADAYVRPQARLMQTLSKEIAARAYVDDETAPVRRGRWLYSVRRSRDREHPVYLRRSVDAPTAEPQVLLDLSALARGKPFLDLGVFEVSDDGNFLAYAIDEVGDENYTLRIKDLATGKHGPEVIPRVTTAAWSADGRELLYTVRDDTYRSYALRSRTRGPDGGDRLVVAEKDARFDLAIRRSRSGEWWFLASEAYTASEVRVARATQSTGAWTTLVDREVGHLYDVDHFGDTFYIRTNRGAPYFRVVMVPESDPRPLRWKELVPERTGIAVAEIAAFAGHLALLERDRGAPRLGILDLRTGSRIRAGDATARRGGSAQTQSIAAIEIDDNPDPYATSVRVTVESVDTPARTIDVAFADGSEREVHARAAGGPCGGVARTWMLARAADGTEVPILKFSGAGEAGPRPLLLEAYGAYGSTYDPDYDATRCVLMQCGVDFAIAWVRGGGELGEPWHAAGQRRGRMTPIADLIAAAEFLIAKGATRSDMLVVAGDSAGGALVGATINQRPELFAGAVLRVPFLDALGTMADPSAPLTTVEYDEWGDPTIREDYDVMRQWCPYTNVRAQAYPPVLVESSLADARVAYHEQARHVARLRRVASGGPFVLRTEVHAGHAGASGRKAWLRGEAFELAFILKQLGGTCPVAPR